MDNKRLNALLAAGCMATFFVPMAANAEDINVTAGDTMNLTDGSADSVTMTGESANTATLNINPTTSYTVNGSTTMNGYSDINASGSGSIAFQDIIVSNAINNNISISNNNVSADSVSVGSTAKADLNVGVNTTTTSLGNLTLQNASNATFTYDNSANNVTFTGVTVSGGSSSDKNTLNLGNGSATLGNVSVEADSYLTMSSSGTLSSAVTLADGANADLSGVSGTASISNLTLGTSTVSLGNVTSTTVNENKTATITSNTSSGSERSLGSLTLESSSVANYSNNSETKGTNNITVASVGTSAELELAGGEWNLLVPVEEEGEEETIDKLTLENSTVNYDTSKIVATTTDVTGNVSETITNTADTTIGAYDINANSTLNLSSNGYETTVGTVTSKGTATSINTDNHDWVLSDVVVNDNAGLTISSTGNKTTSVTQTALNDGSTLSADLANIDMSGNTTTVTNDGSTADVDKAILNLTNATGNNISMGNVTLNSGAKLNLNNGAVSSIGKISGEITSAGASTTLNTDGKEWGLDVNVNDNAGLTITSTGLGTTSVTQTALNNGSILSADLANIDMSNNITTVTNDGGTTDADKATLNLTSNTSAQSVGNLNIGDGSAVVYNTSGTGSVALNVNSVGSGTTSATFNGNNTITYTNNADKSISTITVGENSNLTVNNSNLTDMGSLNLSSGADATYVNGNGVTTSLELNDVDSTSNLNLQNGTWNLNYADNSDINQIELSDTVINIINTNEKRTVTNLNVSGSTVNYDASKIGATNLSFSATSNMNVQNDISNTSIGNVTLNTNSVTNFTNTTTNSDIATNIAIASSDGTSEFSVDNGVWNVSKSTNTALKGATVKANTTMNFDNTTGQSENLGTITLENGAVANYTNAQSAETALALGTGVNDNATVGLRGGTWNLDISSSNLPGINLSDTTANITNTNETKRSISTLNLNGGVSANYDSDKILAVTTNVDGTNNVNIDTLADSTIGTYSLNNGSVLNLGKSGDSTGNTSITNITLVGTNPSASINTTSGDWTIGTTDVAITSGSDLTITNSGAGATTVAKSTVTGGTLLVKNTSSGSASIGNVTLNNGSLGKSADGIDLSKVGMSNANITTTSGTSETKTNNYVYVSNSSTQASGVSAGNLNLGDNSNISYNNVASGVSDANITNLAITSAGSGSAATFSGGTWNISNNASANNVAYNLANATTVNVTNSDTSLTNNNALTLGNNSAISYTNDSVTNINNVNLTSAGTASSVTFNSGTHNLTSSATLPTLNVNTSTVNLNGSQNITNLSVSANATSNVNISDIENTTVSTTNLGTSSILKETVNWADSTYNDVDLGDLNIANSSKIIYTSNGNTESNTAIASIDVTNSGSVTGSAMTFGQGIWDVDYQNALNNNISSMVLNLTGGADVTLNDTGAGSVNISAINSTGASYTNNLELVPTISYGDLTVGSGTLNLTNSTTGQIVVTPIKLSSITVAADATLNADESIGIDNTTINPGVISSFTSTTNIGDTVMYVGQSGTEAQVSGISLTSNSINTLTLDSLTVSTKTSEPTIIENKSDVTLTSALTYNTGTETEPNIVTVPVGTSVSVAAQSNVSIDDGVATLAQGSTVTVDGVSGTVVSGGNFNSSDVYSILPTVALDLRFTPDEDGKTNDYIKFSDSEYTTDSTLYMSFTGDNILDGLPEGENATVFLKVADDNLNLRTIFGGSSYGDNVLVQGNDNRNYFVGYNSDGENYLTNTIRLTSYNVENPLIDNLLLMGDNRECILSNIDMTSILTGTGAYELPNMVASGSFENNSMVVSGNGGGDIRFVSGGDTVALFTVDTTDGVSRNFAFDSLIVKNAKRDNTSDFSTPNGAGLYINQPSTSAVANIVFNSNVTFDSNNASNGNGGAVYNNGGYVVGTDGVVTFTNNSATDGGAIYGNSGEMWFTGGVDAQNNTSTNNGGSVYNVSEFSSAGQISFTGNTAGNDGGAMYNAGTLGIQDIINEETQVVYDCEKLVAQNNTATNGSGGLLYNTSGATANIYATDSNITSNSSGTNGGAIANSGNLNIDGNTLSVVSNVSNTNGGAISNISTDALNPAVLNISSFGQTYESNTATTGSGGALYNSATASIGGTGTVSFTGNLAENGFGGAIATDGGVTSVTATSVTYSANKATNGGAVSSVNNSTVTLSGNQSFVNNTATNGGAVYNQNSNMSIGSNAGYVSFSGNSSTVDGGAVYNERSQLTIGNTNSVTSFYGNVATQKGGAVASVSNDLDLLGVQVFDGNSAVNGGAIASDSSTINMTGSQTFVNNKASNRGGAIYMSGTDADHRSVINITASRAGENSVFSGNTDSTGANAVYMAGNSSLNLNADKANIIFYDPIAGNADNNVINQSGSVYYMADNSNYAGDFTLKDNANAYFTETSSVAPQGGNYTLGNNSTLHLINGKIDVINANSLTLPTGSNVANMTIDMNLDNALSDKFSLSNSTVGNILVTNMSVTGNTDEDYVFFPIAEGAQVDSVQKEVDTRYYTYDVEGGLSGLTLRKGDLADTGLQAGQVAANAATINQLALYNQLLFRVDEIAESRYFTSKNKPNLYASTTYDQHPTIDDTYTPYVNQQDGGCFWLKPSTTIENVSPDGFSGYKNRSWNAILGYETPISTLRGGFEIINTVFGGYQGSFQDFDEATNLQNGGFGGYMANIYRKKFFMGFTALMGGIGVNTTDDGLYGRNQDFGLFNAGAAMRLGYNVGMGKHWLFQPLLTSSYTLISGYNVDNGADEGVAVKPTNTIQIAPGFKVIGNYNGWQPYALFNYDFVLGSRTIAHVNDVTMPEMRVNSYLEYGVGLRKNMGERFTGYLEAVMRNVGRTGPSFQGGLTFKF